MIEIPSAYVQEFDQIAYQEFRSEPQEYSEERRRLDAYTTRQFETLLGERFNLSLSVTQYEIRDGRIYGQNMNDPALESFAKGRDYRRKIGNGIDFERERAEVEGFRKIETFFTSDDTPEGAMMISISPKGKEGSAYQHNFYDIFTKKNGAVEARRYSSALSLEDYSQMFGLDDIYDDAFFLENPLNVTNLFGSADEVHEYLHREHDVTSEEEFRERILVEVAPFIANYIRACAEDGEQAQRLAFNSVLNVADEVRSRIRTKEGGSQYVGIEYSAAAVIRYGMQEVKEVLGGCGSIGGFTLNRGEVFNVSDFDPSMQDQYGSLEVECPACGARSTRPRGQLLERCANESCSDPRAIACKPE